MGENTPVSRNNLRLRLVGLIAGTTGMTLILTLVFGQSTQHSSVWRYLMIAGAVTFTGFLVIHTFLRRLERIIEVTRAWLRGNLNIRINDQHNDDLGMLADDLDQLADHLEEDEEDLNRLSQSNTRLTDQVRALAVVEERNRLARELHDSVKQHLFSLVMTASAIKTRFGSMDDLPADVQEMADEIVHAAQSAQQETTRLIEDLRPGSLAERGLVAALNDYTLLFGAQEHLLIYLDVECKDSQLPPTVAEALYRVVQEALHNVARHAHATRVDVALQCQDNKITLSVEDNGVGFETRNVQQGLGINNMQERLLGVGGRLSVHSQRRIGTTVKAEVVLSAPVVSPTLPPNTERYDRAIVQHWLWLGQKLVIPVG
ncbi:MAG: histidine kinase, partial [Anaerolineae bacterium]|nr:histidine kinase [Anaerolineae bacterium]